LIIKGFLLRCYRFNPQIVTENRNKMPSAYMMTWDGKDARWRKWYKKTLYVISCAALGVPPNKEQSYRAANAWWVAKKRELDAISPPPRHPGIADELSRRRDWARQNDPGLAEELTERLARLDVSEDEAAVELALTPDLDERIEALRSLGIDIPASISRVFLDGIIGDVRVFRARNARPSPKIPQDRTVGAQVEKFLEYQRARVKSGKPSVAEYDLIARYVGEFRDWMRPDSSVDAIDVDKWEAFYVHVLGLSCSVETKKKRYRYGREFVGWLSMKRVIPEPANLTSKKYRFEGGARKVPVMTPEEVKGLIEAAPGQLKLHLLLMANCGYTQTDIAELRPDQVDWKAGRIKRKRSKTENHADVPEVDYKLWPVTLALLLLYGHRDGALALTTQSGLAWVRDVMDASGKRSKTDAIKSNYAHLRKKGFSRPMKLLRKTSATLIEGHNPSYSSHFLGHSPRSIKDRSYTATNGQDFDEIVEWLGRQYGLTTNRN
jgi:integrase